MLGGQRYNNRRSETVCVLLWLTTHSRMFTRRLQVDNDWERERKREFYITSRVLKQIFRVKKNSWGLPPQLELLADSVKSQVHDNLFKLAHTESIGMHIASLMQGHTDTNRLCNYFFLSFAHSELHQTILLFIPSHKVFLA